MKILKKIIAIIAAFLILGIQVTHAAPFQYYDGGIGTSTKGVSGQILEWQSGGFYQAVATSSLNIAGTFSTTSSSYFLSQNQGNAFSTTSALYFLSANQINGFSTTSANYFLSVNQGSAFSTTSVDFWKSQRDLFSTTSALYLISVNQGNAFSTTSSSYFLSQNTGSAFSTTSASYFLINNQGNSFSTTSASYFLAQNTGPAFSTTSASYFLGKNQGNAFSTTSAAYWGSVQGYITNALFTNVGTETTLTTGSNLYAGGIQATSVTASSTFNGGFNVIGNSNTVNFGTALKPVAHFNIYSTDPPIFSSPSGIAANQVIGVIDGAEYEFTDNAGNFTFGDVSNAYTGLAEQFNLAGQLITGTNLVNNPNVQQILNDGSGRFGIGTSTPGTLISLGSGSTFVNLDPFATSTFGHGINIKAGCYAIAGACIGTGTGSGTVTSITATSPLTGGAITTSGSIGCQTASGSQAGCLASADWTTFNGKQASGNYITALTGDFTASGPGSVAATLATVNGNVGSFGGATSIPNLTVNAKGLVTAAGASTPSIPVGDITGTLPVANGGTGITSLGTGIATFLGTPTSANLATAITDETGTGANVFANTPTLVSPILGTPTSGVATNLTGLPLTTGVTGTLPIANGGTNATSYSGSGNSIITLNNAGTAFIATTTPLQVFSGGSGATTNIGGAQAFGVYPIPDNGVGIKNVNTVAPSYAGQFAMNRWETSPPQLLVSSSASTGAWFSSLDVPGGISSVGPVNNTVAATYFQDPNLFRTLIAVNGSPAGFARNGDAELGFINWANGPQQSGTSICDGQMHPLEYTSAFGTASSSLVNTVSICFNHTPWNRDAMIAPGNAQLVFDGSQADIRNLMITSDDDGPTQGNYANAVFDLQQDAKKGDVEFPIWQNYAFQPADSVYNLTVSGVTTAPLGSAVYQDTTNGATYTIDTTTLVAGAGTMTITSTSTPPASGTMHLVPNNSVTLGTPDSNITWTAKTLLRSWLNGFVYDPKTGNTNMAYASSSLLTLTNITGSTQCVQADTNGTLTGTGSTCGGGGGSSTWTTGASSVSGRLINFSNNTTDIPTIGATATTSASMFFDPNAKVSFLSGALGIGSSTPNSQINNSLTLQNGRILVGRGTQQEPSFTFGTSTQTGFHSDNSQFLDFTINGTDRETYTNNGMYSTSYNVGINTGGDASFPLQVLGTGEVAEFGSNAFSTQYIGIRNNSTFGEMLGLAPGYTIGATSGALFEESGVNSGIVFVAGSNVVGQSPNMVISGVQSGGVQIGNVGIASSSPWAVLSLGVQNYFSGTPMFAIGSSTSQGTTTPFMINDAGQMVSSSTAPVLSSCGSNPTVDGTQISGEVTPGAGATGCTVTFSAGNYQTRWTGVANPETESLVNAYTFVPSGDSFTVTQTGIGKFTYVGAFQHN